MEQICKMEMEQAELKFQHLFSLTISSTGFNTSSTYFILWEPFCDERLWPESFFFGQVSV